MIPDAAPGPIEYLISSARVVLATAARFGGAGALLNPAELAAVERFRNPADARGYAAAHILFRVMAGRQLGMETGDVRGLEIHRQCRSCGGAHGKPLIDGANVSLSRSLDQVLVASAATGRPLGADLEAMPRQLHAGFDGYALSRLEQEALAPNDVESRISLWVAKEAALKATGHGLAMAPGRLHLDSPAPRPDGTTAAGWAAVVVAPDVREAHGLKIVWLPSGPRHAAALATTGQPRISKLAVHLAFRRP